MIRFLNENELYAGGVNLYKSTNGGTSWTQITTGIPENITYLEPNQIFVYRANEKAIHGAGAQKLALRWRAKMRQYGLVGQTYGIPTKDKKINTFPLDKIQVHVDTFLAVAFSHPEYEFLLTKIGCGLALYQPKDIAPLFKIIKVFTMAF